MILDDLNFISLVKIAVSRCYRYQIILVTRAKYQVTICNLFATICNQRLQNIKYGGRHSSLWANLTTFLNSQGSLIAALCCHIYLWPEARTLFKSHVLEKSGTHGQLTFTSKQIIWCVCSEALKTLFSTILILKPKYYLLCKSSSFWKPLKL